MPNKAAKSPQDYEALVDYYSECFHYDTVEKWEFLDWLLAEQELTRENGCSPDPVQNVQLIRARAGVIHTREEEKRKLEARVHAADYVASNFEIYVPSYESVRAAAHALWETRCTLDIPGSATEDWRIAESILVQIET